MPTEPEPPDPRVLFAAERTLLAWVRTGLALMGLGFVVARFGLFLHEIAAVHGTAPPAGHGGSLWVGVVLVVLGIAVLAWAGWRYRRYVADLTAGRNPDVPGPVFGLVVTAVLGAAGVGLVAYLLLAG